MAQVEAGRVISIQSPRSPEGERRPSLHFGIRYPRTIVTNDELTREGKLVSASGTILTSEDVLKKVGVETRGVAAPDEHVLKMAEDAARPVVNAMHGELEAIMVPTSYPVGEHLATGVAKRLDRRIDPARLHDVHAACSGGPYALTYMLDNEGVYRDRPFVLVSTESYQQTLCHAADGEKDGTLAETLFHDGAVSVGGVFGRSIRPLVYENYYPWDSFRHDVENMALCMPVEEELNREPDRKLYIPIPHPRDFTEYSIPPDKFFMDGKFVYVMMRGMIPTMINKVMKSLGGVPVKKIFLHQASLPMVEGIRGKLPNELKDKVYVNMRQGNWSSGSTIKGLAETVQTGEIAAGDVVILAGFGAGLCASIVAVEIG